MRCQCAFLTSLCIILSGCASSQKAAVSTGAVGASACCVEGACECRTLVIECGETTCTVTCDEDGTCSVTCDGEACEDATVECTENGCVIRCGDSECAIECTEDGVTATCDGEPCPDCTLVCDGDACRIRCQR